MNVEPILPSTVNLQSHTVLIVDDEPANLGVLSAYLRGVGLQVWVARDGESGIDKAQYGRPDLILLDVRLPDIDGFEACRRLRADEITCDIPVIFVTALASTEDKIRGFEAGAVDFVTKPIQEHEVLARVMTHLRLRDLTNRLRLANETLEKRVEERTHELLETNRALQAEIAEHERTQAALAQEHSLLRTLINSMPDAIYIKDISSRFLLGNEMVAHLMGTTPDQLIGKTDYDFYPDELARQYYDDEQAIVATGRSLIAKEEPQYIGDSGEQRWISTTKVAFRNGQGQIKGIVGIGRDMTERRRIEKALQQSNDDLERRVEQRTAELKKLNRQLAALYKVGQAISSTPLQLPTLLEVIARNIAGLLESDAVTIALADESGTRLAVAGAYDFGGETMRQARARAGVSIASYVVQIGRPIIANDLPNDARFAGVCLTQVLACVSTPLVVADSIIGAIDVYSTTNRHAFSDDHLRMLTMLAGQAAIAIENARLYEEVRRARDQLEVRVRQRTDELVRLNEQLRQEILDRRRADEQLQRRNRGLALLNRVIATSATETEINGILTIVCRELAQAFELPQAAAMLLSAEEHEAVVVAEYLSDGGYRMLGMRLPVASELWLQQMRHNHEPFVTNDSLHDPQLASDYDLLKNRGAVALLIIPLIVDGKVVGVFGLESTVPRSFSDDEIDLAASVAQQVSGVLARIRIEEARRKLEGQYHQAQKMEAIGRLTGGVAHDFNNILTVIVGHCDFLLDDLDESNALRHDVEQIRVAAGRASALTRQLLAFSRQQPLQPVVLDLNKVVTNLEPMLRRLVREDITLATGLDPQLGLVKADPGQIEQVLMNLVVNARDAMPDGGKLTIETTMAYLDESYARRHVGVKAGAYVQIAVSDTGIGMGAETQARIFEPFFTTKPHGEGTGLGLATVHGIVNQSGGHIWVYSEPQRGATFKIYLPQVEPSGEQVKAPVAAPQSQRGTGTILLVEDEQLVRELACRALTAQGYTVLAAADGMQASRICAEHQAQIDLLLTDVIIPGGFNGRQLATNLAAARPDMKILYMSGYTDNAIIHNGILDPGVAFLPKPFALADLIEKIRQVLQDRA